MIIIEDLQNATTDVKALQNYLSDSFEEVYDFFNHEKHSTLVDSGDKINRYIQLNRGVILELDISDKTNLDFISLLLAISEELGLLSSFAFLFEHLQGKNYNIGERLRAASLYLIGITSSDDYINRYEIIYKHLKVSFETEEDSSDKVLMTLINYYAKVIHDFAEFNISAVQALKAKIAKSISENEFSFLHNSIITEILKVDIANFNVAYETIHSILDSFLGRDIPKPIFSKDFLLEHETEYCELLENALTDFKAIRQISVGKYQLIKSDTIFNSLGRGVTILTEENQLFAYMNSYGNMHYDKLIDSFKNIPERFFQQETNLIDWGCGQAMASMTYFDFLNSNDIEQEIKKLTLIEPSEIALKRASLHIKKFNYFAEIETINKDLDSLESGDFRNKKSICKLHLFSNILDINDFSLTALLELIDSNFTGDNYFICVSPYVNDTRTSRLDAFVKHFSKKKNFEKIQSIDNKSGEWKSSWTRVVRIFRVTL